MCNWWQSEANIKGLVIMHQELNIGRTSRNQRLIILSVKRRSAESKIFDILFFAQLGSTRRNTSFLILLQLSLCCRCVMWCIYIKKRHFFSVHRTNALLKNWVLDGLYGRFSCLLDRRFSRGRGNIEIMSIRYTENKSYCALNVMLIYSWL